MTRLTLLATCLVALSACEVERELGGTADLTHLDPPDAGPVPDGGRFDPADLVWDGTTLVDTVDGELYLLGQHGTSRYWGAPHGDLVLTSTAAPAQVIGALFPFGVTDGRKVAVDDDGIVFASPTGLVAANLDGSEPHQLAPERYSWVYLQGSDVLALRDRNELDSGVIRSRVDRIDRASSALTTLATACDDHCSFDHLFLDGSNVFVTQDHAGAAELDQLASGALSRITDLGTASYTVADGVMFGYEFGQYSGTFNRTPLSTMITTTDPEPLTFGTATQTVVDGDFLYISVHSAITPTPTRIFCVPLAGGAAQLVAQGMGVATMVPGPDAIYFSHPVVELNQTNPVTHTELRSFPRCQ